MPISDEELLELCNAVTAAAAALTAAQAVFAGQTHEYEAQYATWVDRRRVVEDAQAVLHAAEAAVAAAMADR